jgi:hypothetical protein
MIETAKPKEEGTSFFDTLRGSALASIPALSALLFVVVAVKVFRASGMETTTTVAIVSTADDVALLKGVILTLLPGFLAGLVAVSVWWWAAVLPAGLHGPDAREQARRGLVSPQAAWAWAMIVMAFFTVWWPVFLVLLLPVLLTTAMLTAVSLPADDRAPTGRKLALYALGSAAVVVIMKLALGFSWARLVVGVVPLLLVPAGVWFGLQRPSIRLGPLMKVFGLAAAATFIGLLTLAPTVWLPLRTITFTAQPPTVDGRVLPTEIAAYVLSSDDKGTSLLLSNPRAVIQVGPDEIEDARPLCVPPESRGRVLTTRASQVLGVDDDPHSPYDVCPNIEQRLLGGG